MDLIIREGGKWDKEADQKNALVQAAAYACQQARSNLANLHFTPIYILALTRTHWSYGILDYRGCVTVVVDGCTDTRSLNEFTLHESVRFSHDPLSQYDLESQSETSHYLFSAVLHSAAECSVPQQNSSSRESPHP